MSTKRILVIDDETSISAVLTDLLEGLGYEVETAHDGKTALKMAERRYDLALVDLSLPGCTGLEILSEIKRNHPETQVVIMTAYASVQTAVKALRQGAYDFITKPFNLDDVQSLVERALERTRLIDENKYLLSELKSRYNFENIIGQSLDSQKAHLMAARVADSNASVLILGETGTGKEFMAKAIHYQSSRADGPFIKVNCAALPEGVLESELFGHEKGAFTHAIARRAGRFEMADGGTLFLDEIGDIPLSTQVKLLRVLQEKEFERVGGSESLKVNVRIVAATNKNLQEAMAAGEFREDLYYRLNVIQIQLPPLRERKDDLPVLVHHFIKKYNRETGKPVEGVSPEAMAQIQNYPWRGNIRELENCIERAVILTNDTMIGTEDLMLNGMGTTPATEAVEETAPVAAPAEAEADAEMIGLSLKDMERKFISATLDSCDWNQSRAASLLGIDRKTLRTKIRDYGLNESHEAQETSETSELAGANA